MKERIIETAASLFYNKGYNLTGINEVISASGIAKATLYNHFKSKEELCLAYLKHKHAVFLKDLEVFADSKAKGKEQILALFDFLYSSFQEKDFNGCWSVNTVAEIPSENEKIRVEIRREKNEFIQLIETLIQHNLASISLQTLPSLAKKIYLLYEGAIVESNLHNSDWPIKEARDLCQKIL